MTIDIFIKSYENDFKFLEYLLYSIRKNVTGYNEVIIVIPKGSTGFPMHVLPDSGVIKEVEEKGDGYLFQQFIKMTAFSYCHADYIMYVDSDCAFHKETDLQKVVKKKPEILYTHYSRVGDAICWKQPTETFLGVSLEYEFMRRLPLVYKRKTLENLYAMKGLGLEKYIMSRKNRQFSEFNVIGAYAFMNENKEYTFVNTDDWQYVEPLVHQGWSWNSSWKEEEEKIKKSLGL